MEKGLSKEVSYFEILAACLHILETKGTATDEYPST